MNLEVALVVVALAASVMLVLSSQARSLAIVAVVVSAIQALRAFGILRVDLAGLPLALILGAVLATVGVLLYLKSSGKRAITASTCVALVGVLQVLAAARFLR